MSLMKFEISGMHCDSCKMLIEDVLEDMDIGIKSLNVDKDSQKGTLEVDTDRTPEDIIKAIQDEGDYKVNKA